MHATTRRQTAPVGPLLHGVPEACAFLGGVSQSTVYDLINRGALVRVKIGRRAFITDDSLRAYVRRLAAPGGDAS